MLSLQSCVGLSAISVPSQKLPWVVWNCRTLGPFSRNTQATMHSVNRCKNAISHKADAVYTKDRAAGQRSTELAEVVLIWRNYEELPGPTTTSFPLRTELYHTAKLVVNCCWNLCSFFLPSSYKIVPLPQVQHCHLLDLSGRKLDRKPTIQKSGSELFHWGGHGLWLISAAEDRMKS